MPPRRPALARGALLSSTGVLRRLASPGERAPLSRSWLAALLLVLVGVVVLGSVAVRFAPAGSSVAVWWPAAGLAAAFLLATGPDRRRAGLVVLGVLVATGLANWYGGRPPLAAACFGVANAAESAVFWACMAGSGRRPRLGSLEDLGRLLLATVAGAATFGLLAGAAVKLTLAGTFLPTAYAVAASHAAAVLVIAPLGVVVRSRRSQRLRLEDVLQWVALIGVTLAVFGTTRAVPLAFLPLPVLVWGATRLHLRTVAAQLLVVSVVVIVLTNRGDGPFATAARQSGYRPETVGALTQAFLVTAAVTTLALAVSTVQRRTALEALRREAQFASVVLDSVTSSIVVVGPDGRVERVNAMAARYLGRQEGEVVGVPVGEVFPADPATSSAVPGAEGAEGVDAGPREQDWDVDGLGVRRMVWSRGFLTDEAGRRTHEVRTGTDVTEELASRLFIETVLNSAAATAIIGTDRDGVITLFNAGATNLLGRAAEDVVGELNWVELHDPDEIEGAARQQGVEPGPEVIVHEVLRTGESRNRDWTWLTSDGQRIVVDHTTSRILDPSGRVTGFLTVAEDVTQRREADLATAQALAREREAVEELTALDRTKTDFLSAVSHELRTPLASVLGYTELLEDGGAGPLSPRQNEVVARIDRNGRRLLALIEDLLINSRIEAGQLDLAHVPCDLVPVVETVWDAAVVQAQHRDLDLRLDLPEGPVVVEGDPAALERVVTNLLSNAVKFTPDGGRVELVLAAEGQPTVGGPDGGADRDVAHRGPGVPMARIAVRDTGIGIPQGDRGQVFRRFYRSAAATDRAVPGAGLGLSIVKAVVDGLGGTVDVESQEGAGSTFTVRLPLARSTAKHSD